MRLLNRIRGGALLTALFIMTLVAIVATAMSMHLQTDIYRTQLILKQEQLYMASQAVTFWGLDQLKDKNKHFNKLLEQGMVAIYPAEAQNLIPGIKISGGLYDMQAKFNLNNLNNKFIFNTFINLLKQILPDLSPVEAKNLALAIQDWVSIYDLSKGNDGYLNYYLGQKPPYYPSHGLIQSLSEFRAIKGVAAALYQTLEPYICTLPEPTLININTASQQLLMSLGNGFSEKQLDTLLTTRAKQVIDDKMINKFLNKIDLPLSILTVESNYFLAIGDATSDERNIRVYTLFKRQINKNGAIEVSVVRESLNGF